MLRQDMKIFGGQFWSLKPVVQPPPCKASMNYKNLEHITYPGGYLGGYLGTLQARSQKVCKRGGLPNIRSKPNKNSSEIYTIGR
jgi:hypothetical protein